MVRRTGPDSDLRFYLRAYGIIGVVAFALSYAAPGFVAVGCGRFCTARTGGAQVPTEAGSVSFLGHVLSAVAVVAFLLVLHGAWTLWSMRGDRTERTPQRPEK